MAPEHMASEAAIREQAYYFWEQDGRPQGRETEHWQRASVAVAGDAQLSTLTEGAPKRAKAPATKASKGGPATKLKAAASTIRGAPAKMVKAKDTPRAKPKKK